MATKENTKANPSLPQNIMHEILSRLPAETLLELEYDDCESWKSLISDPYFIKTHLSKSSNDPNFAHHHFLLVHWPCVEKANIPYMKLSSRSVYSVLNDTVKETIDDYDDYPGLFHPGDNDIDVIGYANGLFCVTYSKIHSVRRYDTGVYLWNPCTGLERRLPESEPGHRAIACCYDESNDDFKVFAGFCHSDYKYIVSVYSSRSDCWRIIGDYLSGEIRSSANFANGAIHWLVRRPDMQLSKIIIVSLDIKTETFREVLQPPTNGEGADMTLDTFCESLSLLYYYNNIRVDFWVMKGCGVGESWTKLFTIPSEVRLPYLNHIKPLCICVNGDLILLCRSTIVLYNPHDKTSKDLLDTDFDQLYVYTYVKSLVSPKLKLGHSRK